MDSDLYRDKDKLNNSPQNSKTEPARSPRVRVVHTKLRGNVPEPKRIIDQPYKKAR